MTWAIARFFLPGHLATREEDGKDGTIVFFQTLFHARARETHFNFRLSTFDFQLATFTL